MPFPKGAAVEACVTAMVGAGVVATAPAGAGVSRAVGGGVSGAEVTGAGVTAPPQTRASVEAGVSSTGRSAEVGLPKSNSKLYWLVLPFFVFVFWCDEREGRWRGGKTNRQTEGGGEERINTTRERWADCTVKTQERQGTTGPRQAHGQHDTNTTGIKKEGLYL